MTLRQAALHVGLFAACCVTTALSGGPYFAATLMGILLCHELGHYVVGRIRGVDVSLPYFIPTPPQLTFGTFGAVIGMKREISDRNALFDVGASGPVAGLIAAIPLLVIGLQHSTLIPIQPDGNIEGNSMLYAVLKFAVFGRWLPDATTDVQLHPVAQAAWIGLLITMINLLPIGQLDGGHIARAVLGQRHERWSARLHVLLPIIAVATGGAMFIAGLRSGRKIPEALDYARWGFFPWLVWAAMLAWMRRQAGEYHPPVGDAPLDARRRLAALGMLLIFELIATPVPFRPAL